SSLDEIRRSSVHLALGWYLGEPIDNQGDDPQVRLAVRGGGRCGAIHGSVGPDVLLIPPPFISGTTSTVTPLHDQNDIFGGFFFGVDAILVDRQTRFGDVKLTLGSELSNDWINFSGFESGNLTTASISLGFMLSR